MQSLNAIWRCKNSSIRVINLISKYRSFQVPAVNSSQLNVLRYSQFSEKDNLLSKQRTHEDVTDQVKITRNKEFVAPIFSNLSDESIKVFLAECGLENITHRHIKDAKSIMSMTVQSLKAVGLIPSHRNVPQYMVSQIKDLELNIDDCALNDAMTLENVRFHILSQYLTKLLRLTDPQRDYLLRGYPKVKSKPFKEIRLTYEFFTNELGVDPKKKCHRYVLGIDNENLRSILAIGSIGGVNIRILLARNPFVMSGTARTILDTVAHVKRFGIPETAIPHCLEIFKLAPQTVFFRLTELFKIEEFNVFRDHPRVLRLVSNFQTAIIRLQCLKKCPSRRYTLNVLTQQNDEWFIRAATQGLVKVKRCEIDQYLSTIFGRSIEETQMAISKQPNYKNFSNVYMKRNIDYLIGKGFSRDDIFENLYIIVYPRSKINEFLEKLKDESLPAELNINVNQLNRSQQLKLCAYLIEAPFHFSGDGVWPDSNGDEVDQMDVDELRDFMNRLRSIDHLNDEKQDDGNKDASVEKMQQISYNFRTYKAQNQKSKNPFLSECGIVNLADCHMNAKTIMSKTVMSLKSEGLIPSHRNVPEYMVSQIKDTELNIDDCEVNDAMTLGDVRNRILNLYLTNIFQLSDSQREQLLKSYPKIKSKTFREFRLTRYIINELGMEPKKKFHRYVLGANYENLRKIIDIGSIGGVDIRILLSKYPFIMTITAKHIKDVVQMINKFGICESAIPHCMEILRYSTETVNCRLTELSKIEEFNVFRDHPRVLRLVTSFQTAKIRLQCMKLLPPKRYTLNVLTQQNDECFIRIATQGLKKTDCSDVGLYLSRIFGRTIEETLETISKQPNYKSFSNIYMKRNIDYLIEKGFSKDDIFKNLYIIVYPRSKIDTFLEKLKDDSLSTEFNINGNQLSNSQRLKMCAYLIEAPFHFSGDGVWPDSNEGKGRDENGEDYDESEPADKLRDLLKKLRADSSKT